ncbi:cation:dicarboxylate symporter family transporter [Sphingobium sp. CCH11-B1]|uniref:cation:dicarboxylate symporter family transporter n=1 Tax=Sphingobium sp. CCH11-B1 TaxID=1768781 RepID=UPI00082DFBB2|nr:cation:dicarboxylase symporter family transporter [Sphingobium sp. CCH11-B1]MEA3390218.1 cation:dicarboxylase symporter family transporter [Pseudomonadota bacterium]
MFRQLYVQMVVGVLAGTVLGYAWPAAGIALAPLGLAFIKIMRMMVPPILFCTIVNGIVLHGGALRTGSTIARALVIFLAITMVALLSGMMVGMVMQPGTGLNLRSVALDVAPHVQQSGAPINGPGDFLLRMIPDTFFSAFTAGDVLPVLFIAGLVGFGLIRIGPAGEPIAKGLRALTQLQFAIFGFLVRLAPVGAFGAIAYTVGAYGIGFIGSLGMLVATLAVACLVLAGILVLTVQIATGLHGWALLRHFRDELLIVVGTSSSEVVLPRLITKLEAMGVSPAVVGLTVPLGYTLNLAGTAVYLVVATLFLSEALGIPLPPDRLAPYLLVMLATSKTAAGVTGSGFSALLLTLSLLPDIPLSAAAMLIAVDRILSPIRATTSGLANISATLLVARWDGARIERITPPAKPPPEA